jgi:hypothetical protein
MSLFEAHLAVSAEALVENAVAALIVFATFIIAETCIITAAIFLLHEWLLSWWLPLAIAGTATLGAALAAAIRISKKAAGPHIE